MNKILSIIFFAGAAVMSVQAASREKEPVEPFDRGIGRSTSVFIPAGTIGAGASFSYSNYSLGNGINDTGYQMLFSAGGGGFKDYVQLNQNPSTSVTLEVGRTEAPVPASEMNEIWAQNKFVPFYTMKWAKEKGK